MKTSDIYSELENGLIFLLTPEWLKDWEEDEKKFFEKDEQEAPRDIV